MKPFIYRCAGWVLSCILFTVPVRAQANHDPAAGRLAADANSAFAVDLYKRVVDGNAGENIFFSPYSLSSALAMLAEGARGDTATQIAKVLHFPSIPDSRDLAPVHSSMAALYRQFNTNAAPPATAPAVAPPQAGRRGRGMPVREPYQLAVANALWGEQSYPFLPEYVQTIQKHYGSAGLFPVDFRHNADAARLKINSWVEDQTQQKIKDLLPPRSVDPVTRLVLTNAVYFKGMWENPFSPQATQPAPFHLNAGSSVQVPLMHGGGTLEYMENDQLQAVSMPYFGQGPGGGGMSMVILLPRKVDGLADLEKSLSHETLSSWLASESMQRQRVQLVLPKFKMTQEFQLAPTLAKMGMPDAFDGSVADFSGMSPAARADRLSVSFVIHKTFVDVNEQGTEAAAATAIGMRGGGRGPQEPPAVFRADHPFLFMIRHNSTGTILFLGRLMNPAD